MEIDEVDCLDGLSMHECPQEDTYAHLTPQMLELFLEIVPASDSMFKLKTRETMKFVKLEVQTTHKKQHCNTICRIDARKIQAIDVISSKTRKTDWQTRRNERK